MQVTFKQWMKNTYDHEELQAIAEHGCASGVAGGMIYYSETCALYDKHAEELHDVLGDWIDEIGENPEFITKHLGHCASFKNAMVWFVAELYANDILDTLKCEVEA